MKFNTTTIIVLAALLFSVPSLSAEPNKPNISAIVSLLLSGESSGTPSSDNSPKLTFMTASGLDQVVMAWTPGTDGKTPASEVQYRIHLSTSKNFTPNSDNLKKTVSDIHQATVNSLTTNTLYYGKVVAVYSDASFELSNTLETKTYKYLPALDPTVTVVKSSDLGLGKHTTPDGIEYVYNSGSPPIPGNYLISEHIDGGLTLRLVDSVIQSGTTITVYTSDASLTEILDQGSIYSSFQFVDIQEQSKGLSAPGARVLEAKSSILSDGSLHSRMDWKNGLLVAKQTLFASQEEGIEILPQGKTSIIKVIPEKAVDSRFTATVTADFKPTLITQAEWGEDLFKELKSAQVAANGKLTLTAIAQYDFSASGEVEKKVVKIQELEWVATYIVGPGVLVYQTITLTINIEFSAEAMAEVQAMATAQLTEEVEVGARYDGSTWNPYIINNENESLTASLDISGEAKGEIRIVPNIEIAFYKTIGANLSVEPYVESTITATETTNNVDFISANPERLIHITSFGASLGLDANINIFLRALGKSWDILEKTCVMGTGESCKKSFNALELFSIPTMNLLKVDLGGGETSLRFRVTDGTRNPFSVGSIKWEIYPADATITPGQCFTARPSTECTATMTLPPDNDTEYTVFASGHGVLDEFGRQFRELPVGGTCADQGYDPPERITRGELEWQRCDDGKEYNWTDAKEYCSDLQLGGHSDWRLPTLIELNTLVQCTNGTSTPLEMFPGHPNWCGDTNGGSGGGFDTPTIDPAFQAQSDIYWSNTAAIGGKAWRINFDDGHNHDVNRGNLQFVRCVR